MPLEALRLDQLGPELDSILTDRLTHTLRLAASRLGVHEVRHELLGLRNPEQKVRTEQAIRVRRERPLLNLLEAIRIRIVVNLDRTRTLVDEHGLWSP